MFRKAMTAALLGLSATAMLAPAEAYPRISGGGENLTITYGPERGHTVVGGAAASLQGGGENKLYVAPPGGRAREGRIGVVEGGQRNQQLRYLDGRPHGWAGTPADIDERGHPG